MVLAVAIVPASPLSICKAWNKPKRKTKPKSRRRAHIKHKQKRNRCTLFFSSSKRCYKKKYPYMRMRNRVSYGIYHTKPLDPNAPKSSMSPSITVDPVINVMPPSANRVEKECCGNILIEGKLSGLQIWETDVDAASTIVQVSVYSNSSSTGELEIEITGDEKRRLNLPPGNTTHFLGQGIRSVSLYSRDNEHTYIEGKYVISLVK